MVSNCSVKSLKNHIKIFALLHFNRLKFLIHTIVIFTSSAAYADTLVINAAGSLAGNVGPVMNVLINGKVIATNEVKNTTYQDYTFTTPTLIPGTKLDIAFTNDTVITTSTGKQDRNLFVKLVKVNGTILPIASAIYDKGAGPAAFDGINVVSAADNTPAMPWSGALRFTLSSGLTAQQLGLVINDNDPYSVAVGEYYRVKRNIPAANIVHVKLPVDLEITRDQFAPVKQQIDAVLPKYVQAIALAWEKPYRVECNSITSVMAMGFQDLCSDTCLYSPISNPYYNTTTELPYSQNGIRPSMLLAAKDVAGAKALIDKGFASNRTRPTGSAYIMKTVDTIRNRRAGAYPAAFLGKVLSSYVNVNVVKGDYIADTKDALFYFQGLANVPVVSSNYFPPGAIVDSLTSYSGRLEDPLGQMSILEYIAAGATGSYGAVSEPCAHFLKFPNPKIVIANYTSGKTLIESYWKSVSYIYQGLYIGDPLANPWERLSPVKDTMAPIATNLIAVIFSPRTLPNDPARNDIYWNGSNDNFSVANYKIYKNGQLYKTINANDPFYIGDTSIITSPPTTYTYTISAVDNSGNESVKSAPISVTTNNQVIVPPGCEASGVSSSYCRH